MTDETRSFALFIRGVPRTKGHMEVVNKATGAMRDREVSRRWTDLCARALADHVKAIDWRTIEGPCTVHFTFYNTPDPTASAFGDWDTLARSTGDALTRAQVYVDDRLVVSAGVDLYETDAASVGVLVLVTAGRPVAQ